MLRALRFSAQLGFTIEEHTYQAICELAPTIAQVSMERINVELVKLLTSDHPECMRQVYESGLTKVFLPEFDIMMETEQQNKHHCYTVGEHTIHAMMGIDPVRHLRLAMLFHDIGKPATKTTDEQGQDHFYGHQEVGAGMTGEIMRRLKFDNDTIHKVKRLVRFHDERPEIKRKTIRKAMVRMGAECFPDIFDVKTADTLAQSQYHRQEKLADIEAFRQMYLDILAEGECVEKKDLAIDGRDLLAMGVPQGKALGELLQELFELVVEHPEKNTKEYLLAEAEKRIK
jgi:tRNA nucleotidyltransferase (CCA-adding enzyme)